jgi:hypothetical protein
VAAAAAGFLTAGEAGTDGLGLDTVGLVAGNAPPVATLGPPSWRTQPERMEPAAGGRRLDCDAGRRQGLRLGGQLSGAAAWHASMAALTAMPEFHAWQRCNPTFKPLLSGSLWTAQGPRRVTVLLDTGATNCFICARLAAALGLRPSGQPGPTSRFRRQRRERRGDSWNRC